MQKTFRKRKVRLLVGLLFLLGILGFCYFENNAITISEYEMSSEKIPQSFEGFVIVHVSDLHNKLFGEKQGRIISKIKKCSPDIIVITGDLIDSNHPDVEKGMMFVKEAVKIAPVYFVTGNHDNWLSDTNTFQLFQGMENCGVAVLKDEMCLIEDEKTEEVITIMGLDDDTLYYKSRIRDTMEKLSGEKGTDSYTILLAHEPQLLPVYAEFDVDLVLSGHAHGGQFRIPFVGGFVAPDQGFLPEYTKGVYEENGTKMVVSAGLGNSVVPLRLLNRPELVKITLKHQ